MSTTKPPHGLKISPAETQTNPHAGKLRALVRFARWHTVIGTTCQVVGVFIVVAAGAPLTPAALSILALTWLGSQAANLYVVGLNQLTDVPIDRVNKPTLPLASGEFTRREGQIIVGLAGVGALLIGAAQSPYLLLTLALVMAIGSMYSLPPLRFKSRPLAAAISIAVARGVIANLGLFLHYQTVIRGTFHPSANQPVWALVFFFGFGLVVALFKDIPDRDGDRHFAVRTFAVRWGPRRVFQLGRWLLTALYILAVIAAIVLWPTRAGGPLVLAHLAALGVFWTLSAMTDPTQPRSMARLYLALWGLFYAEYVFLSLNALAFAS
jgi:homogentisate phytyltransferase/homogentisate geranylgeranyltransferase